jgi:hypothetical protein
MPEHPPFIYAQGEPFIIYAVTLSGHISELQVHSGSTVLDVKRLVEEKKCIPVDQQRIVYKGQELPDGEIIHRLQADSGYSLTNACLVATVISIHKIESVRAHALQPTEQRT